MSKKLSSKERPSSGVIEAWISLMRSQHAVLSHIENALKQAGLPPLVWYDVLLELNRTPQSGLRPFEIERAMLLPQYSLSRLLDRIEKAGYISKQPCKDDGRGHIVLITAEGKELKKRMWPIYASAIQRAVGEKLTSKEVKMLKELLGKL